MATYTLDARRLLCPMPVIRAQNRIKTLAKGDVLEVICTDPGAKNDLPTWCRINGHAVIEIEAKDDEIIIKIAVGEE